MLPASLTSQGPPEPTATRIAPPLVVIQPRRAGAASLAQVFVGVSQNQPLGHVPAEQATPNCSVRGCSFHTWTERPPVTVLQPVIQVWYQAPMSIPHPGIASQVLPLRRKIAPWFCTNQARPLRSTVMS